MAAKKKKAIDSVQLNVRVTRELAEKLRLTSVAVSAASLNAFCEASLVAAVQVAGRYRLLGGFALRPVRSWRHQPVRLVKKKARSRGGAKRAARP